MDHEQFATTVAARMAEVERRVTAACQRAGRSRSDVTIVAVTKQLSVEATSALPGLGLEHLGESRPQDLWKKAAALEGKSVQWHMIGHLQRNKIERTLPLAAVIHAVDSIRLLEALDELAGKSNKIAQIMLEVNASGEQTKQGFSPSSSAIGELIEAIAKAKYLQVRGLMTMAAPLSNPEDCRPTFAALRHLRDKLRKKLNPSHEFNDLSMGMSNDFEIAVEEGATLIRLGSVYFEGLDL